jgi:transposase
MSQVTVITGRERRRRWGEDDQRRILTAAFAPGAVVADISRQNDISTSLIYKWRRDALATREGAAFAPAIIVGGAGPVAPEAAAITVELAGGTRVRIGAQASVALVAATLRALR